MEKTKFDWITKSRSGCSCDKEADVYVSYHNVSKNSDKKRISFLFRNNSYQLITSTEFVMFAVKKNRIYFDMANVINGFKLTKSSRTNDTLMRFSARIEDAERVCLYNDFIGDHSLKYDDFNELYYIEKENI